MKLKLLYTFLAIVLLQTSLFGQKIWIGATSDWNTASNWFPSGVPANSDDVQIPSITSPNVYPILTVSRTCRTITFTGNSGIVTVNSGFTLTVTNAITLNSSNTSPRDIQITGAGTLSCGSVVVGLSSSTPTASISTKLTSTISNLTILGNITLNSTTNTQSNNAIFNLESGIVNLSGRITTVNGSSSNNSTFSMATGAQSGTLLLSYNGANPFNLSGTGTSTTTLNGTGATVNYSRNGGQTVRATPYNNLTLSNSGIKTFSAVTTVSKIWSVESGVVANLGTGFTHTAGALQLGGYGQNSGSWGSTVSSATNKSKLYFGISATGIINVSTSCSSVGVTISGSNVICKNANTTFTATATNGVSPSYQWKVNGSNVGTNSATFSSTALNNGDVVTCVVTSGATTCYPSGTTATSNSISMAVSTLTATGTPTTVASGGAVSLGTSIVPTSYTETLLTEGFNAASIPTGWAKTNTSTGGATANADWTLRPDGYFYEYTATGNFPPYTFRSNDNSQFYLTNSAAQDGSSTATTLRTPSMNSMGYTSLSLEFYQFYDDYDGDDSVIVEVTTVAGGGSGWTAVATYTSDQGTQNAFSATTVNLNSYINQPTLYVRFRYAAVFEWFWAIDNVKITGSKPITYTYSWAATPSGTTAGLPGTAGTPSSANASIAANPTITTSYVATAVNSVTSCSVASSAVVITVTPTIASFTPTSACSASGASVVITGSAFTGATAVTFNNIAASFTVDSNTQITATLPATATTGTIKVTTAAGTVTSASDFTVTALPVAPTVSKTDFTCATPSGTITVTSPVPVSGTTYTIKGPSPAVTTVTNSSGVFPNLAAGNYTVTYQVGSGCVSSSTPITINNPVVTNTWNGSVWSTGSTPTINDNVIIDGAGLTVSTGLNICSCQVNSGFNVIVNSGIVLKIENGLTGAGTITFNDSASLVQTNNITNTGTIIYKRTTSAIKDFDYVYWGSPVADQVLNTLSPLTDKFYSWNSGGWAVEARTGSMGIGKGYIIRVPRYVTSQTVSFEGVPNNGIISVPSQGEDQNNLIGNPYPSAIDADAFIGANSTLISGALYFWTHNTARAINGGGTAMIYTSDDYAAYTLTGGTGTFAAKSTDTNGDGIGDGTVPSGDIAAGQSFFVGSTGVGNFVFNNGMRISDSGKNSQFFKQTATKKEAKVEKSRIWLNLTNDEGAFKQLLVGYITGATNDKDRLYDGVSNNANKFIDFYSQDNSQKYTIQGRALPFVPTDEVPLGYKSTIDGAFKISIENTDGVLTNQEVYLEDKLTGNYHDLKNGAYSFTTAQGEFKDRFVLRYTGKTLGIDDTQNPTRGKGVVVSVKKHQIKVNSFDEPIKSVKVYDLKGSLVYNKEKLSGNEFVINQLTSSDQFLIVMIQLESGKWHSEEVIYQN